MALHTLSSALATGSIEGAVAGGGTAIAIPKVDEYLKQQGYDEDTRKAVLVGLSAGIGGTVGNSTAGLASSVNQTEDNYLSHIQMQKWAEQLKACKGESVCINGINQYYQSLNKEQDKRLNSVCINNFNNAQCKAEIANFYAGLPKGSAPFQNDYNQISAFGGGILRNNVTASNDMAFSDIIRKGLANISRAENRPGDAIAADLMNAELWGGGAGRLGTVTKAKPVIQQKPVQTNNKIDANSDSNKAIIQAESLAQKKISQNQKNTTNLSRKPNSTVLNQKLATDLKAGKLPGKAEKSGIPREMPKTATPSQTADDFARRYLGRKPNTEDFERGSEMNGGDCSGCWRSQTSDGAPNVRIVVTPTQTT